ncbi:KTSC domain-containing protein [Parafilimonas sp.]|uniref:KTSC domain-containing protein n=1 Tax=Parafilimonas sp. TaxID=1969739 RepID=UPI0039E33B6E
MGKIAGKEKMEDILSVANSSTINRIKYENDNDTLEVEFTSGSIYQYVDVPSYVWNEFKAQIEAGGSAGSFFNRTIKDNYRYSKV